MRTAADLAAEASAEPADAADGDVALSDVADVAEAADGDAPTLVVTALYNYVGRDDASLSFRHGDLIQVLTQLPSGWWDGLCGGRRGWFPSTYVSKPVALPADAPITHEAVVAALALERSAQQSAPPAAATQELSAHPEAQLAQESQQKQQRDLRISIQSHQSAESTSACSSPGAFVPTRSFSRSQAPSGQHPDLPPNWNSKTSPDGRIYYYNHITNETCWTIQETHDERNARLEAFVSQPSSASTSADDMDPSDAFARRLDADRPVEWSWSGMTARIISRIHLLANSVSFSRKTEYISAASAVIDAVRTMLYASGTPRRDSPVLATNHLLRQHHHQMHLLLSQLAIEAQLASTVWPPPDAATKLAQIATDLIVVVRNFALVADEHNVVIKPMPEMLHRRLPDQKPAQTHEASTLQEASPTETSPIDSSYDISGANLIAYLELSMHRILRISKDLSNPTHLSNSLFPGNNLISTSGRGPAFDSVALITVVRSIVKEVGSFLECVDELPLDSLSEDLTVDFKVSRLALYNAISGLVMSTQMVTNSMRHINVVHEVASAAQLVEKSVRDLLISTKYLIEEKESCDQMELQTFIQQHASQEASANRPPSGEQQMHRQRRMFSMSYAQSQARGTSGAKSNLNAETNVQKQCNDLNQDCAKSPMHSEELPAPTNHLHRHMQIKSHILQRSMSDSTLLHKQSMPEMSTSNKLLAPTLSASPEPMPLSAGAIPSDTFDAFATLSLSRPGAETTEAFSATRRSSKLRQLLGDDAGSGSRSKSDIVWYLRPDFEPDEIVVNADGQIRGGTLKALVDKLTLHNSVDANFTLRFLLTYKSFTNSLDLFRLLETRFMVQPPKGLAYSQLKEWTDLKLTPIRLRVFNVLKSWVEHYLSDEESDREVLNLMHEFAQTTMSAHMSAASTQLLSLINRRIEQGPGPLLSRVVTTGTRDYPSPILPKNMQRFRLLDIDALELARQLTILESETFARIQPAEFLNKAWSLRSKTDASAKGVRGMISLSNRIMSWTAATILAETDVKKRSKIICYFISVAERCVSLNNFSGLMAIIGSLDSAHVHRLRKTWDLIPSRQMSTYESLRATMSSSRNFSSYRSALRSANPPCIPFLGCYLTDLTFIADGNPDTIKGRSDIINFGKMTKTADIIRDIQQFQLIKFSLIKVPEIQDFLESVLVENRNDEDFYAISLRLEPRVTESVVGTSAMPLSRIHKLPPLMTRSPSVPLPPQPLSASSATSASSLMSAMPHTATTLSPESLSSAGSSQSAPQLPSVHMTTEPPLDPTTSDAAGSAEDGSSPGPKDAPDSSTSTNSALRDSLVSTISVRTSMHARSSSMSSTFSASTHIMSASHRSSSSASLSSTKLSVHTAAHESMSTLVGSRPPGSARESSASAGNSFESSNTSTKQDGSKSKMVSLWELSGFV